MDFAVPADHKVKMKESEKLDKYFDFARELKRYIKSDSDTTCWCAWKSAQRPRKETRGTRNQWKNRNHLDHMTVIIC